MIVLILKLRKDFVCLAIRKIPCETPYGQGMAICDCFTLVAAGCASR
jgi:hypothetical protein